MLKYVLLAGAMTLSAPLLAQTKPATADPAPAAAAKPAPVAPAPAQDAATTVADPAAPVTATADASPAQQPMATEAVPASDAQVAQAAPADPAVATAPVETAAAAPVNKADQVTAVVNSEFASYDKDGNGTLNAAEFGAWMVALKTASDPATKADSAETKTYVSGAFASADADKNKAISKSELTGFLSQG